MNIFREVRRFKKKSMHLRIISILLFSVTFIVTTYAWFSTQNDIIAGGLEGNVTSWDVSYYVKDNEVLEQTALFTIDELYPGMPNREDIVHIYNEGTSSTIINYELLSVKVFGQEVLKQLQPDEVITIDPDTNEKTKTIKIFSDETKKYPFYISYTYDKVDENGDAVLEDKYISDTATPQSHGTMKFNVSWPYEDESDIGAKDDLDTKFGKDAYQYYKNEANDPSKAIEIKVKITSSKMF